MLKFLKTCLGQIENEWVNECVSVCVREREREREMEHERKIEGFKLVKNRHTEMKVSLFISYNSMENITRFMGFRQYMK